MKSFSQNRRRHFPETVCLVLWLLLLACSGCGDGGAPVRGSVSPASVEPWNEEPVVRTVPGQVMGFEDRADTWVWKAIPYARPPTGPLRWKAPRDPVPWEEIRRRTNFSEPCPQYLALGDSILGNEDCLYLNVWRPRSAERKLPVYFWIHGGGNSIGSAVVGEDYNGANLASLSGVVVVTVNYRLGPLGWFTHPAIRSGAAGDARDASGNYGTLDLIKALEWVRDNIEAFGGDPGNVTITGESAGAANVLTLLISPPAEGLFHRALAQSGGARSNPLAAGDAASRTVILTRLLKDGIAANPGEAEAILDAMSLAEVEAYLRSQRPRELLKCYQPNFGGMISFPYNFEDGTVIPAGGFKVLETGAYPGKVPVILGTNKEEKKLFIFADSAFTGRDDLYQVVASYASDVWKATGVDQVARKLRSHPDQPGVYAYQFLWGAYRETGGSVIPDPWGFKLGCCHTLEIPFFFGNDTINVLMQLLVFSEENRAGREALSRAMMAYMAAFARTGDPNGARARLPAWLPWSNDPGAPRCIQFDVGEDQEPLLRMSAEEFTEEGVKARMAAEVPEPLYSEAVAHLGW